MAPIAAPGTVESRQVERRVRIAGERKVVFERWGNGRFSVTSSVRRNPTQELARFEFSHSSPVSLFDRDWRSEDAGKWACSRKFSGDKSEAEGMKRALQSMHIEDGSKTADLALKALSLELWEHIHAQRPLAEGAVVTEVTVLVGEDRKPMKVTLLE